MVGTQASDTFCGFCWAASICTEYWVPPLPTPPIIPPHFIIIYSLGGTKERLKEVIEECQLHRNKLHGDIIEYLLQEKNGG